MKRTRYESPFKDFFKEPKPPKKEPKPRAITKRFEFHVDAVADKDVVEKLDTQINRSEYIRDLIRKDIRGA